VSHPGSGPGSGSGSPEDSEAPAPNEDAAARWRKTEELFHRAMNLPMDLPAAERIARLNEWCGADVELRDSVVALLEADSCVEELISAAPPVGIEDFLLRRPEGDSSGSGDDDLEPEDDNEEDIWIGRVLGAFRLERLLGRGGMGVVYLGERVLDRFGGGLTQKVAIKLVGRHLRSSPAVAQFLLERETLAQLEHAHIARLLDGGVTSEGFPYVVMEYIEGRRLDVACDDPSTSVQQMIRWMLQLCDAVTYVHRNLILHRDLKPGNVMVTDDGSVKLLDFGTLKRIGPGADTDSEMTQAGMRPVTVRYASPEHIQGTSVSTATDVYSLGMILYRLIAGRLPEELDNLPIGQYLDRLRSGQFKPPSEAAVNNPAGRKLDAQAARDLDAIVAKSLRYEAEARYPTAGALANDLWNLLLHRPVTARDGSLRYRASKFYRRYRWPILASAAAVAVLTAGLSTMAWQGHLAHLEQLRADKGVEDERKLAHMLLFDYFDQLLLIPGSTDAQRKAVTQATAYLDRLSLIASDSNLELDTIRGYKELGDLLGNPYEQNLGNVPEAIQVLNKGISIAQARVQRAPHDLPSLLALASVESALGNIYFGEQNAGMAEKYLQDAATTSKAIVGDPHVDATALRRSAAVLDSLGDVYDPGKGMVTANLDKAMDNYRLSDQYDRQCLKMNPGNKQCRDDVIVGQYKFGLLLEDIDPAASLSHYRDGLAVTDQFTEEEKKTTRAMRLRNFVTVRLGLMELRVGHIAEGEAHVKAAQASFRQAIAKDDLDNRSRYDLASAGTDVATEYNELGREVEAHATVQECLEMLSTLRQRNPQNSRWEMVEVRDLLTLGKVETKLGHAAQASSANSKAVTEIEELARRKDATPEILVMAVNALLRLHLHPQDPGLALGFAERAASAFPKPTPDQLLALASAQRATGHTKEAVKNAQLVLDELAGPVKSKAIADDIAEARRILRQS